MQSKVFSPYFVPSGTYKTIAAIKENTVMYKYILTNFVINGDNTNLPLFINIIARPI